MVAPAASMPFTILFALANRTVERMLSMDSDTAGALGALEGKALAILVTEPKLALRLDITDGYFRLASHGGESVDVTLEGSAGSLWSLLRSRDALYGGEVKATGDLGVAQQFGEILAGMHIDWEEEIATVTGDAVARRIGVVGRDFRRWAERTASALRDNTSDYLQDESRLLVPPELLDTLHDEIDVVRQDVDRLEARIRLLEDAQRTARE